MYEKIIIKDITYLNLKIQKMTYKLKRKEYFIILYAF